MPLSNNLEVYHDTERALRLALANPSGAIQPMPGATFEERRKRATRFRQRAYHFRELLRKASHAYEGTSKAALVGTTEFDTIVIRINENGDIILTREGLELPPPIGLDGIEAPTVPELPMNDVLDLDLENPPRPDFTRAKEMFARLELEEDKSK